MLLNAAYYYGYVFILAMSYLMISGNAVPLTIGSRSSASANVTSSISTRTTTSPLLHGTRALDDDGDEDMMTPPPERPLDPKLLVLQKLLSDKCNSDDENLPKECKLQLPEGNMLSLRKKAKGPTTEGKLGAQIGDPGEYGAVFDIIGQWSTKPKKRVVAKWFKYKREGLEELQNLLSLHEADDYGIDTYKKIPSLWAIIFWKKGDNIKNLKSYKVAISSNDRKVCEAYMKKVRKAIVAASMEYFRLPGAPQHADLNRGNVLIWEEEDKNHVVTLHVNLIDFGLVDWNMDEDEVADEGFIDYLAQELEKELEKGIEYDEGKKKPDNYDFSDENNCH